MQKKLMRGLGMSATLLDADEAGFLGHEEAMAVTKARVDFASYSAGLAAEFIHIHSEPVLAKQAMRAALQEIETETGQFSDDEAVLAEHFARELEQAIDTVASKSGWQRSLTRLMFRTPTFIKLLVFVALFTALAVGIGKVLVK